MRGEIFQTWMALTMGSKKKRGRIHTWVEGEKELILSGLDESEVINSAADFIATVLEVKSVVAYPVGEGEDIEENTLRFPIGARYRLCLRVLAMGFNTLFSSMVFVRFVLAGRLSSTSEIHQIVSRLWPKRPPRAKKF